MNQNEVNRGVFSGGSRRAVSHQALAWFWVKGDQSLHLCLPDHGTLPSITQSLFGFAAISFHHRAPLCRCKLLFVSALWKSENYSANVQRETISAVCLPVFVCLGACLCGCGYRCKRSRRSRPLQNKLINWPFVRAETDPTRHEDKKRE